VILAVISAVVGALVSSVLACIPGLHVYNVMGLLVLAIHGLAGQGAGLPPEVLVPGAAGFVVGYALLNTIPAVLLAAPDESALFTVLPGQKYLMAGKGYEGTMLTALGGLAGLLVLVFVIGPLAPRFLPMARSVLHPHTHWIVWCVIAFMLLSEWPKGDPIGQGGWRRFLSSWRSLGAGLLTFLLAGFLGFILLYRSPISHESSFQNLMPGFVGLFTVPWLVLNVAARAQVPPQSSTMRSVGVATVMKGLLAGGVGGGFAAFFPAVTGGVGGFLAGHATAIRNDRVFLVSQGASKLVYYVGSFMLFFVPGLRLTRGGAAWMLRGLYVPKATYDYYLVLASIAIAGAVSVLLIGPLTRLTIGVIRRFHYRHVSLASLALVLIIVLAITRWTGLGVMLVATGIGLIPVLFGSRRMNCLGVILLPIACNLSGVGDKVATWFGLL